MSWSVSRSGKKDDVKALVAQDFDTAAASYPSGPEHDDILTMKDRVLALVDAVDVTPDEVMANPGVQISAWGSHGVSDGKLWQAQISVTVSRVSLPAEAPAPTPAEPAAS